MRIRETDLEPAELDVYGAHLSCVGEGRLQLEREGHRCHQVVQQLLLTAVGSPGALERPVGSGLPFTGFIRIARW